MFSGVSSVIYLLNSVFANLNLWLRVKKNIFQAHFCRKMTMKMNNFNLFTFIIVGYIFVANSAFSIWARNKKIFHNTAVCLHRGNQKMNFGFCRLI